MNEELIERAKRLGLPVKKDIRENLCFFPVDADKLISSIKNFRKKHGVKIINLNFDGGAFYASYSVMIPEEELIKSIDVATKDIECKIKYLREKIS